MHKEGTQLKGETYTVGSKAGRDRASKPFEAKDTRYGATGFGVDSAKFYSCFMAVFPH